MLIRLFQQPPIGCGPPLFRRRLGVCTVLRTGYCEVRRRRPRTAEAEKRLERRHRLRAAVVSKHKLVEVDLEVATADPVVGSCEPLLQWYRWRGRPVARQSSPPCEVRFSEVESEGRA